MLKTNLQILQEVRTFLETSELNKEKYVTKKGAFSKSKKLSFINVVLFLLQLPKKSLSIELEDFFESINSTQNVCTKSALSQARYKLNEDYFDQWNKSLVKSYYTDNDEAIVSWKGFSLQGVDGTTLYLSDHEGLRSRFGTLSNQYQTYPMARIVGRYDLLNELIVDTKIGSIKRGEVSYAIEQLDEITKNVLSIYDRNFANFETIYEHYKRGLPFLIRSKLTANNLVMDFVKSEDITSIVNFPPTQAAIDSYKKRGIYLTEKDSVPIRLIKVKLKTGELEILITSLLDQEEYPNEIFGELYSKRWGSEICFDVLKNKLQLCLFCGQKPEAIIQEIHATVLNCNLNSILVKGCRKEEEKLSQKRKHAYKVNKNVSIGIMKKKVIQIFYLPQNDVEELINHLIQKFNRYMEPVREGRSFDRKFKEKTRRSKFYTLRNYARAF